jgi:FAD/FMN-containing dehydrogenase
MASWKNWAETVSYTTLEKTYQPRGLKGLQSAVIEAAKNKWKLRATGPTRHAHAWSNLGVPAHGKGAIIEMGGLNQIVSLDPRNLTVEVQAGTTIKTLTEHLFRSGYALENMGDSNPQTIAGAISTETHGSGGGLGSLSELVEGIRMVTAPDGALEDLQEDALRAARVSLGKLGAIYTVKLRIEKNYYLHHKQQLVRFEDERNTIRTLLNDHRHLEYWYYPYTGRAERITRKKLLVPETSNELSSLDEWFIKKTTEFNEGIGLRSPHKLPGLFQRYVVDKNPLFAPFERKGPWHKVLLGKSNVWRGAVKTFTMEYQFAFDNLWPAFAALEKSIEVARDKCVFVASPVHIRFSRKSLRSLLSHLRFEPTVSFSASFFRKHRGAHTWFPDLERRLIDLGGKPHWGKMYYVTPPKGAEAAEFEIIQKRLDPNGVFAFEQGPYTPDPEAFQAV